MTHLLDTDHLSILQRGGGIGYAELTARITQVGEDRVALCIVSLHEQCLGSHAYINRARSAEEVARGYGMLGRVLTSFAAAPVLPFDDRAAKIYTDLASRRLRLSTMDLRIASIAVSRCLVLLTRNVSDFGRIAELRTEDWTVASA